MSHVRSGFDVKAATILTRIGPAGATGPAGADGARGPAGPAPDDWLIVQSTADLPDPAGDEHVLPANKTVVLAGTINLGARALRLSEGTLLRGLGGDSVISTNASGVIRATNLGAAVVMREFSVVALGGPALVLTGTIDHQLNLFFMGLIGVSAGTITGFDVQGIKSCFINAADGLTLAGTTNKVFIDGNPFYGIAPGNAGLRLAADLDCDVADILTNFFKYDTANCFEAVAGYRVGEGKLRGNLIDGTAVPLTGLSPADTQWYMRDNTGIRDSRTAAQSYLTAAATTTITAMGTYTPVLGAFTLVDMSERFELNADNELVYTGTVPVLVTFNAVFTIDPANNNRLSFKARRDGVLLDQSEVIVEQGAGAGASPRPGFIVALIEVVTGTRIGLSVANLSSADNVPWLTATYAANAG